MCVSVGEKQSALCHLIFCLNFTKINRIKLDTKRIPYINMTISGMYISVCVCVCVCVPACVCVCVCVHAHLCMLLG